MTGALDKALPVCSFFIQSEWEKWLRGACPSLLRVTPLNSLFLHFFTAKSSIGLKCAKELIKGTNSRLTSASLVNTVEPCYAYYLISVQRIHFHLLRQNVHCTYTYSMEWKFLLFLVRHNLFIWQHSKISNSKFSTISLVFINELA